MYLEAHADYEARNPDELEYAQAVENHRQAVWLQSHDTLAGYTPLREFPCGGSLRAIPELSDDRFVVVACDCCAWSSTVLREHVKQMWAAPEPSTPF